MIRTAALAAVLLLAPPAFGQNPTALAPGEQVQVSADSLVIDEAAKQATFTGNVVIARTGLSVTAQAVTVVYGSGIDDIRSFDATGSVRIETAGQTATGERARFDPNSQILKLTGSVFVQNSAGTMAGAELTVNLATNETVFKGGEGVRVTGTFTPQ